MYEISRACMFLIHPRLISCIVFPIFDYPMIIKNGSSAFPVGWIGSNPP